MKFLAMVKASKASEAGQMPGEKILNEMGKFNEELVKAGMMLDGQGLHPSSKGTRLHFANGKVTVTDGPFPETKELVAGYWLLKANSKQEVIDWIKRAPFHTDDKTNGEADVEIRQLFEPEDFGADIAKQERALLKEAEKLRAEA